MSNASKASMQVPMPRKWPSSAGNRRHQHYLLQNEMGLSTTREKATCQWRCGNRCSLQGRDRGQQHGLARVFEESKAAGESRGRDDEDCEKGGDWGFAAGDEPLFVTGFLE
ncbi:hypothetical protein BC830DRAFT_1076941 [Chytriomyces sp. MP71]|nr:hypothetical protein BC830DRAFT_1076941 [Chytriomyces sp. MP71]